MVNFMSGLILVPNWVKKGKGLKSAKLSIWTPFFFYITGLLVRCLGLYRNIELWPQRLFEVKIYLFFPPKCTFLYPFMFFSNGAYGAVNETHIFTTYRFRAIFYILVCLNRAIFKESVVGQKGQKEVTQLKIGKFPFICIILV